MGRLGRLREALRAKPSEAASGIPTQPTRGGAAASRPSEQPVGADRLVELFRAVDDGVLPLSHACIRAGDLGRAGGLSPQAIEMVAESAFRRIPQDARQAWTLARIVYAGAEAACPTGGSGPVVAAEALGKAAADLVSASHAVLSEVGDVLVFTAAWRAGTRALEVFDQLGDRRQHGVVLQRRGAMVLDCYTAGRTRANHGGEFQHWVEKAMFTGDPELLRASSTAVRGDGDVPGALDGDDQPLRWPEPLEALRLAEADLRGALADVEPARRGYVLKALAQCLQWRPVFGGADAGQELARVCQAALVELDPDDVQAHLAVAAMLRQIEADAGELGAGERGAGAAPVALPDSVEQLVRRLETGWDDVVASTPPDSAWDAVAQAVSSLVDVDPARALRLLPRQQELTDLWAQEARRTHHHAVTLQLFARSHASPAWMRVFDSPQAFEEVRADVAACVPASTIAQARRLAAGLTLVMQASTKHDREGMGLQAFEVLQSVDAAAWQEHLGAFADLEANLLQGEAINLERAEHPVEALPLYLEAASRFVDLGAGDRLVGCLQYLADTVAGSTGADLTPVSGWLAAHSLVVELLAPKAGPAAVQRLVRVVVARQVDAGTSVEEVQLLLQAAKGRRFAATLAAGTTGWTPDARTTWLLGQVAEAERALPTEGPLLSPPSWEDALDRDDLVTAYVSDFESSPSDSPEGVVTNHHRAVERALMESLTPHDDRFGTPVVLQQIQAALGSRTALLLLFEGMWVDGRVATYSLLVTREHEHLAVSVDDMPHGAVRAAAAGREVELPPSGFLVGAIRRAVQEEPAPLDVSRQGEELLASVAQRYLRTLEEHLDELTATGKDHLLVSAHGAAHFLPLHLLGSAGTPLADRWTVTYLANLAQLTTPPRQAPDGRRRRGTAVLALAYADQPRLPRLDSSAAEAAAIAAAARAVPVLDGAVTETAFRRALETKRHVHLRAHGRHDVDAPLFQTVFLAPGDGGDGRLRAHEVLAWDLRGLELVTLGACETALGRVDASDNVRGMSAALLQAGAQAVIGTLWEVAAEASTTFFTSLYGQLATDDDDDLVTAFGVAQRHTRAQHPEYRDWGAFYLTGGCRRPQEGR